MTTEANQQQFLDLAATLRNGAYFNLAEILETDKIDRTKEWTKRQEEQNKFEDAILKARSFSDLPEDVREIWARAEEAQAKYNTQNDATSNLGQVIGVRF